MKFEIFKFVYPVVLIGILSFYQAKYYDAKFDKKDNEINEIQAKLDKNQAKFDKEVNNNYCYIIEMILLLKC